MRLFLELAAPLPALIDDPCRLLSPANSVVKRAVPCHGLDIRPTDRMKTTSQTTDCIACGSKDVTLVSMHFMGDHDARFPICPDCETFLNSVFADPSFGHGYITFLGVTAVRESNQNGGAFSCEIRDDAMPTDFKNRVEDFDLYCAFVAERIRALRSTGETNG